MKPSLPIRSSRKTMRKPPKYTPVPVSLTVSLMVMLQGRCARHSCVCALSFPGDGSHIMWHARRHLKCCSFKHELKHLQGNPCSKNHHESNCLWFFTGNTAPFVVHSTKGSKTFLWDTAVSLDMRLNLINWLSSSATLFCEAAAHGKRPLLTSRLCSIEAFLRDTTASCGRRPSFTKATTSEHTSKRKPVRERTSSHTILRRPPM